MPTLTPLVYVEQQEGRYDGGMLVPSSVIPVSALIRIKDPSGTLAALDLRGQRVDIDWGMDTTTGVVTVSTAGAPCFVIQQRVVSYQGELLCELYCMSLWDYVRQLWRNQTTGLQIIWEPGGTNAATVLEIIHELLGGAVVDAAVFKTSGGVYTSYTTAAGTRNSVTVDDVFPLAAAPAVSDEFYIGSLSLYDHVTIDLLTTGSWVGSIIWEYWNGASWSGLSIGTVSGDAVTTFEIGRLKFFTFDLPTDWATINGNTTDITDGAGAGDPAFPNSAQYYIRGRITAFTSITTRPNIARITVAMDYGVALDTSTAGQGDDETPTYISQYNQDIAETLEDILSLTTLGIICQNDGFHAKNIDNAQSPADNTYGPTHVFFQNVQQKTLTIPNTVIYTNEEPGDSPVSRFEGTDNQAASVTALGAIRRIIIDEAVVSNAKGLTLATRAVNRWLRDVAQGEVLAPMHCGQEVWDLVRVEDTRSGQNYEGRVSHITRIWKPGSYNILVTMGGSEWASVAPLSIPEPVTFTSEQIKAAIGGVGPGFSSTVIAQPLSPALRRALQPPVSHPELLVAPGLRYRWVTRPNEPDGGHYELVP